MSLINQMLKDLDKRRGPVNRSQLTALQGMGLVNSKRFNWYDSLFITAWGVAGLLMIVMSYHASTWWISRPEPEPVITPQTATEVAVAEQIATSDTLTIDDNSNAETLATTEKAEPMEKPLDIPLAPQAGEVQATPHTPAETVVRPVLILTPEQKAERLFARAQQALSSHQKQNGERLLQQVLDENPRHVAARSQLAALLLGRQREDRAENLLADGLLTDSRQLALARPYSQLLAVRGKLVPALETLDRAIVEGQADPETLALRAAILYRMQRHSESAAAYRQALRIQPDRALWWTGLAVALEQHGQSKQALEAFQRAADLPLNKPVVEYVKQRIDVLSDKDFHY